MSTPPEDASSTTTRNPLARRWLVNIVLLVIVAGFGFFAWYRSANPPAESKTLLTDLKSDAVQTIEFERPREPKVVLKRSGSGWRLTSPISARADSFMVKSLLRVLQAPVLGEIPVPDNNLARYELKSPKIVARFDSTEIAFGGRHPLKDEQYVKTGSAVRLISNQYFAQAAARYTNLIDSHLIAEDRKLVSIKLPDFSLSLSDGTWKREPEISALSSDRINAFVDEWRHARALKVQPLAKSGTASENVIIGFEKPEGDKSEIKIAVLSRKPELVLYRPDEKLEYHFSEDTGKRLLQLEASKAEKAAAKEHDKKSAQE